VTIAFSSNPLQKPPAPQTGARPRLTFLGTGYLGSTYAICFADLGYEVLGVDVDVDKIAKLSSGEVPIHEPGLDELLRKNLASGRLRFTTDFAEAGEFGDVHFICVGTPQRGRRHGGRPALRRGRGDHLTPHIRRKALIVGSRRCRSAPRSGSSSWWPVRPTRRSASRSPGARSSSVRGFAVEDVIRPDRVVFGVKTEWARDMLYAAHKGSFDLATNEDREVPVVITDFATAELVKVAANAFLATKISFINAMAEVCEAAGRRCDATRPGHRLRRPHRQQVPPRPASASAAAACPRTSARSSPAPRSWGPARRSASCTRST